MKSKAKQSNRTCGFTLVELSLVIVIIGLIVVGVVSGSSLVRQAKLRSVVSDIQKFDVAMNAFKLEYNYLPGDLPNATSYWGGSSNGNGNGTIREVPNSGNGHSGEYLLAWEHLGQNGAKLLPFPFTYVGVWQVGSKADRDRALPFNGLGYHWGIYRRSIYKTHQYVLGADDTLNGVFAATNSLSAKDAFSLEPVQELFSVLVCLFLTSSWK